jgi:hypothetical protein
MTRDRTRDKGPRRGCCVGTARARVVARVSTLPSCTCELNRVSRSLFICQACEFTEHADVVGSMNVKNRAVVKGLGEEGLEVVATAATVSADPLDSILGFADGTSVTVRQELTPLNCFGAHANTQAPRAGRELGRMRLSLKRKQEKSHRTVALAQAAAPIPTSQEAFA